MSASVAVEQVRPRGAAQPARGPSDTPTQRVRRNVLGSREMFLANYGMLPPVHEERCAPARRPLLPRRPALSCAQPKDQARRQGLRRVRRGEHTSDRAIAAPDCDFHRAGEGPRARGGQERRACRHTRRAGAGRAQIQAQGPRGPPHQRPSASQRARACVLVCEQGAEVVDDAPEIGAGHAPAAKAAPAATSIENIVEQIPGDAQRCVRLHGARPGPRLMPSQRQRHERVRRRRAGPPLGHQRRAHTCGRARRGHERRC
jgi:hypothetical protein